MKYLYIILLLLTACTSSKRMVNKSSTHTDSSSTTHTVREAVHRSDSSGAKSDQGHYERETVYLYDTIYTPGVGRTDIRYMPRIVYVKEKGTYAKTEQAQVSKVDSSKVDSTGKTEMKKGGTGKAVDVKKSRPAWILWVIVALIILAILLVIRWLSKRGK